MMMFVVLLAACGETALQSPDSGSSADARPDAAADTGASDTGSPDTGAPDTGSSDTGSSDTGSDPDGGEPADAGAGDGGTPSCPGLQRDVCLMTPGCVLDGSENDDPGYFCRDALTACEMIQDPGACQAASDCILLGAECYCAEGDVCACGGGRAQVCREICGGIAGVQCPTADFFCNLPMDDGTPGGPVCIGNGDQQGTCTPIPPTCAGSGGTEVCGCDNDITPVTYPNDCERRSAGASLGQFGACP
jgi:hypothetical protein